MNARLAIGVSPMMLCEDWLKPLLVVVQQLDYTVSNYSYGLELHSQDIDAAHCKPAVPLPNMSFP
jgi:hypothetical protein